MNPIIVIWYIHAVFLATAVLRQPQLLYFNAFKTLRRFTANLKMWSYDSLRRSGRRKLKDLFVFQQIHCYTKRIIYRSILLTLLTLYKYHIHYFLREYQSIFF